MRCHVDLHCHSSASFDSRLKPDALLRLARAAGLTHVAVTDHDRIDGALRIRDDAPPGLTIIVGEEVRTASGDVIGLYLERPIPGGLSLDATIAAIREQGGMVGIPHPLCADRSLTVATATKQPSLGSQYGQ